MASDDAQLSRYLSNVMEEIGVTEDIVNARRTVWLQRETLHTHSKRLKGQNITAYNFGSQSEGTTTWGLKSDVDFLTQDHNARVIETTKEWLFGATNLLLCQTKTLTPGYRYLMLMNKEQPMPLTSIPSNYEECVLSENGDIYLKNTVLHDKGPGSLINGPACTVKGKNGDWDKDFIKAFHTQHWPSEATEWKTRIRKNSTWPTEELKTTAVESGCFLVPVGHKQSQTPHIEFRISTTFAERLLLHSLNITQIRTLVILKMLMKAHVNFIHYNSMKSFYSKTALLYAIEEGTTGEWREDNIIACLKKCLLWLKMCLDRKCIPHYIMPSLNMFEERFTSTITNQMSNIIERIHDNISHCLYSILIDDLGERLNTKYIIPSVADTYVFEDLPLKIIERISRVNILSYHLEFSLCLRCCTKHNIDIEIEMIRKWISKLEQDLSDDSSVKHTVMYRFKPLFSSTLGSLLVSKNLRDGEHAHVKETTINLLKYGMSSDATSGRLKYASVLICIGDYDRACDILKHCEEDYNLDVIEPISGLYVQPFVKANPDFVDKATYLLHSKTAETHAAYCVIFTRNEKQCAPGELWFEMHRSSEEELGKRKSGFYWMDWACLDAFPYIYFLQYLTYKHLRHEEEKKHALVKLLEASKIVGNMYHRETTFNILGQCFEHEHDKGKAMESYQDSLEIMPDNNAANYHIRRLAEPNQGECCWERCKDVY